MTTALSLAPAATAGAPASPYQFDVAVAPGDGAGLKANADLNAQFTTLQTSLQLGLEANPNLVRSDPLALAPQASASRETLGLNAAWVGPGAARLDLQVGEKLDQAWATPAFLASGGHQVDTDDLTARLDLSLTPLKAVDLTVGGGAEQRNILDTALAQAAAPESQRLFATATQDAHAGLKWRLTSWLSLNAGGKLEMADAQWRGPSTSGGATAAGLTYAFIEPSVDGAVTLPGKGQLDLSLTRAVSPIDAGAFATFAATEDRAASARFGPNREWRYRLSFDQKLAAMKLSAAVTQARIESATELGPVGADTQAPVAVTGGERQQVDLDLSAPLAAIGLPSLTLTSSGTWRNSRLRDPFTGEMRRASAESPQTAKIALVQSLAGLKARWGLEGQFGGDLALYQMSQISRVSVDDSLGGFVEYAPGSFALRLQVDGLYGGGRQTTDTIFAGPRANGFVERVDHHVDDGQAVRLVLKKAL
ncbi:hypothetical protein [Phenylobacterium montanum]|uniref:TonB-dependent receptor n=1 Tax=Phenylobacterium montanum TaxID=2823693 RepID=A0A975FWB4_9CAUL|nr:hypothetical protein [Caulobacter sp. S6]QUD86485.1 hypothetical protein KCG34_15455 [Caulobacter sp. S6]